MKIKIIVTGKLKEKYLKDGIAEYTKRLSRFCDLTITELPDEKIPDNASAAQEKGILQKEGERILKCVSPQDFVVPLCVEGKQLSSEELAGTIEKVTTSGTNSIAFIIGGSLGLSDEVKRAGHLKLSFSKMTFPHQLMRLCLIEQIYRAFKINANETYHK